MTGPKYKSLNGLYQPIYISLFFVTNIDVENYILVVLRHKNCMDDDATCGVHRIADNEQGCSGDWI